MTNYEVDTLRRLCEGTYSLRVYHYGKLKWRRNARTVRELLEGTGLKRTDFTRREEEVCVRSLWSGRWCRPFFFVLKDRRRENDRGWWLFGKDRVVDPKALAVLAERGINPNF